MDVILQEQWSLIAILFFGIIGYIAWIRWRDNRWIEKRFGRDRIIAMSFGVNYFGRSSEPGKPGRSSGFLLLLKDRIFYKSRLAKLEVEIPGQAITQIYPDNSHKGVDLHQSVIKIDFRLDNGQIDSVAFRVPYPPQWINAIKNMSPSETRKSSP